MTKRSTRATEHWLCYLTMAGRLGWHSCLNLPTRMSVTKGSLGNLKTYSYSKWKFYSQWLWYGWLANRSLLLPWNERLCLPLNMVGKKTVRGEWKPGQDLRALCGKWEEMPTRRMEKGVGDVVRAVTCLRAISVQKQNRACDDSWLDCSGVDILPVGDGRKCVVMLLLKPLSTPQVGKIELASSLCSITP